ncbi:alpha-hydroxy-acid oxidizing protein [Ktedonosporobacter rubrisoli]|uniref:Alpha-hydroxy-acid oxidizing protein n=1 Tax=Ktedonosporobacter rubrisoli TaxID=2509675 RepID=A0A4P6K0G7_KTERU|nr:alpha-hydroxy acid oxidase [Ktedonosporobacter rubrisoli]QBD81293.1 alpha-hydroxy-acid oxidizing protein [Ktedonosporobacter rubrisoli]
MVLPPLNLFEYEKQAQEHLDTAVWDHYQGGSDDEVTLRACRDAFAQVWLRPRALVDVSSCDLRTTVLGTPISVPVLVAPTGGQGLAHSEGELATVRGAGAAGTLMVVAMFSTRSLEEIAQQATGPRWLQLYVRSRAQTRHVVQRAQAAGYQALVLTVDSPRPARCERDWRNGFAGFPFGNYDEAEFIDPRATEGDKALIQDAVTWEMLDWLRSLTSLPIVLKGILTAEDARFALEHGVAGLIVSNHGGRRLDGSVPALMALPEVIEAVAGRCEVYLDGGIRRGTDVLKALALGARAVLVGRPVLWGLAVNGEQGVRHVLSILSQELETAMALAGCPGVKQIHSSLVRQRGTFGSREPASL